MVQNDMRVYWNSIFVNSEKKKVIKVINKIDQGDMI